MSTEPQLGRRMTWIGVVVILAILGLVGGLTLAV
jgi:hypothetical protein